MPAGARAPVCASAGKSARARSGWNRSPRPLENGSPPLPAPVILDSVAPPIAVNRNRPTLTASSVCRYAALSLRSLAFSSGSFVRSLVELVTLDSSRRPGALDLKHWQEMAHILDRVVALGRQGRATALAMVTQISGSAYRRPGAKLLVDAGGGLPGRHQRRLPRGGRARDRPRRARIGATRVLHYDTGTDETKLWGLGLGCDGEVDILVQPICRRRRGAPGGAWTCVRALLDGDAPVRAGDAGRRRGGAPGRHGGRRHARAARGRAR